MQRNTNQDRAQKSLGFFLQCNGDSESSTWSCDAQADLRLLSTKTGVTPFSRRMLFFRILQFFLIFLNFFSPVIFHTLSFFQFFIYHIFLVIFSQSVIFPLLFNFSNFCSVVILYFSGLFFIFSKKNPSK